MGQNWLLIVELLVLMSSLGCAHQPFEWTLIRAKDSKIVRKTITAISPRFNVTVCDLLMATIPQQCGKGGGKPSVTVNKGATYWCPTSNPRRSFCNYPGHYHCGYWGCETIATAWRPERPDRFLRVQWGPPHCTPPALGGLVLPNEPSNCEYLQVQILNHEDRGWLTGRTWGVRLDRLYADPGEYVTIRKQPLTAYSQFVGPNLEIKESRDDTPEKEKEKENKVLTRPAPQETKVIKTSPTESVKENKVPQGEVESMLNMVEASYKAINYTDPDMTESCWLCYNVKPPFYEGVGLNLTFNFSTEDNPSQCRWGEREVGLTMSQISGKGACIGNVSPSSEDLCGTKVNKLEGEKNKWVIPHQGGWWICSKTGLVPCVSVSAFRRNNEFCVQVSVLPHMLYRTGESVFEFWEMNEHHIQKREPISITIAMLLGLGATGAGVASLVQHSHGLTALRTAVDEDLDRIEKSISYLETSLNSLSEVVLQNRRGLDLLFLQQGGLCVALGEECCFYANHSGVIKESMSKLREGILQRKREREATQSWIETWHNQFPWLAALVSTLAGPLVLLFASLVFGPCILNKIIAFAKKRIDTVQLLTIKQQYEDMSGRSSDEDQVSLPETTGEAIIRFDQQIYEEIRRGDCYK